MILPGYALNIDGAQFVECEAPAVAGQYGATQRRPVEPGFWVLITDSPVVVRDSHAKELRQGAGGSKLEVPVTPDVPLTVLLSSGWLACAARDTAATLWLVPLVRLDGEPVSLHG